MEQVISNSNKGRDEDTLYNWNKHAQEWSTVQSKVQVKRGKGKGRN